jgi:hypothetical protein
MVIVAGGADAEDFEVVTLDREVRVASQIADQVVDGTASEGDDDTALGADEVMPVTGLTDDVGWMKTRLQEPSQDIERGENFQGAVDRCSPDCREFFDDLLGGKGALMSENGIDHSPAGVGQPVAVLVEHAHHMIGGWEEFGSRERSRHHGGEG